MQFHPPHLCRIAVFSIKPTFSLGQSLWCEPINISPFDKSSSDKQTPRVLLGMGRPKTFACVGGICLLSHKNSFAAVVCCVPGPMNAEPCDPARCAALLVINTACTQRCVVLAIRTTQHCTRIRPGATNATRHTQDQRQHAALVTQRVSTRRTGDERLNRGALRHS